MLTLPPQAANEPDLYFAHGHRPSTYGPFDYFGEFSDLLTQLASSGKDPNGRVRVSVPCGGVHGSSPRSPLLSPRYPMTMSRSLTPPSGPSTADAGWTPEMVWDTNFVDVYSENLAFLSVEK